MDNLYDLLNIGGNKEELIKSCVDNARYDLRNVIEKQRCKIFSSYVSDLLNSKHVVNKIIRTGDFSSYDHHFVMVPKDGDNYYLIDLTYSQFNNDYFSNLLDNGYEIINGGSLLLYLSIVTGEVIDQDIDEFYFNNKKM